MANAQTRGWGHPDDAGYRQRNIVTITVQGVKLHVHRAVAHLFSGFLNELCQTGYRLDVDADDWGYNNRDIRGRPGVKSNHAWGLAIDINALKNPMTEAHPGHAGQPGHDHRGVHTDMPPQTGALASKWGLRWGANYTGSRKDAMHFQFEGTPADVAKYPDARATPQKPPEPLPPEDDDMATDTKLATVEDGPHKGRTYLLREHRRHLQNDASIAEHENSGVKWWEGKYVSFRLLEDSYPPLEQGRDD